MSCGQAGLPLDESNLVMKALRLFERKTGKSMNYHIDLVKRIPHGAGLGGGSSDAATVLMALNEMEGINLPRAELMSMAGELGSDVPFFIDGGICRCTGRCESVSPMPEMSGFKADVLLLRPSFGVSTPDAYKRWKDSRELPGVSYAARTWNGMEFVNDLERPVFEKYMFLAEIKSWLLEQEGVEVAMMSGSGSTVFAIFNSSADGNVLAAKAKEQIDPTLWAWSGHCHGNQNLTSHAKDCSSDHA